ncbi:MAG: thermonuclease family protein [Candidatus Shapirobacteria bacterium]|nr:thermonuclease family protein [Candidatus Shapirobacteria bacterium]
MSWIAGIFFLLGSMAFMKQSVVTGLAFLGLAILILPLTRKWFERIKKPIKILIGIALLIVAMATMPSSNKTEVKVENAKPTITEENKITPTTAEEINKDNYVLVKVIDGDTLTVKINDKEESVRLIGIDAPESNECMGTEATEKLKEMLENKEIKLEADESQENQDVYGRLLRYVFIDGQLINQRMITDGWAKEYTFKVAYKYQEKFKEVENQAKENKKGIWGGNICPTNTPKISPVEEKIMGVKTQQNTGFVCDCSKTCTQMNSCEEAYFQLTTCGCSKRDSDDDGVPCESLCR